MEGTLGISTCFVILIFLVNLVIISYLLSVALFGMRILEHTNLKAFLRKAFFFKKFIVLQEIKLFASHISLRSKQNQIESLKQLCQNI
jgi:hypothetical protein